MAYDTEDFDIGKFSIVDCRCIYVAVSLSVTCGIVYVLTVLGSNVANKFTPWSRNKIEKELAISRGNADKVISRLIAAGLLRRKGSRTKPVYEIGPFSSLAEKYQEAADQSPAARIEALVTGDRPLFELIDNEAEIYVPVSLIDETDARPAVLQTLLCNGNATLAAEFFALYRHQDLETDGGLSCLIHCEPLEFTRQALDNKANNWRRLPSTAFASKALHGPDCLVSRSLYDLVDLGLACVELVIFLSVDVDSEVLWPLRPNAEPWRKAWRDRDEDFLLGDEGMSLIIPFEEFEARVVRVFQLFELAATTNTGRGLFVMIQKEREGIRRMVEMWEAET